MLYRTLLGVLLVVAVLLTLNERLQEQRSERPTQAAGIGVPRQAAPSQSAAGGYPLPTPPPTPLPGGDAYPVATAGPPFVPHNVRLRVDVDLKAAPDVAAGPAQPISRLSDGLQARAVDRRGDWYLIDTGLTSGWAPAADVDEP